MSRPRLLDLFCGAGGAAVGYHRAGFEVVGVDIKPQPHYPFEFHQGDALTIGAELFASRRFDAVHASPPCQEYSTVSPQDKAYPDLYAPTRDLLESWGVPFAIENVIGAPYRSGVTLCGSMFDNGEGEWLRRHRNFETSMLLFEPQHRCKGRDRRPLTVTGQCVLAVTKDVSRHSRQGSWDDVQAVMGIDWMTRKEIVQSIPPAYTEWIGRQLLAAIEAAA